MLDPKLYVEVGAQQLAKAARTPAKACKDPLRGGKASGKSPDSFDPTQLAIGTRHEREHTKDEKVAQRIAMDHLAEDPSYYKKLAKIEKARFVRPHYRKGNKVRGYSSPKDLEALDKDHLFELGKSSVTSGDWELFRLCRDEMERRVFMQKAYSTLADLQAVDGKRPIDRDKKVFNAKHGVDEENSSTTTDDPRRKKIKREDAEVKGTPPLGAATRGEMEKAELVAELRKVIATEVQKQLGKAILTKPSEAREKPAKKAKSNPKGKVGSNTKGKTYQYPDKDRKGGLPGQAVEVKPQKNEPPLPPAQLNPERFAKLIGTSVSALTQLALKLDVHKFVNYFNTKAAHIIEKYEIPHDYWKELHHELRKAAAADKAKQSIEGKQQFTVDPGAYAKGSESYDLAKSLKAEKVFNITRLEQFLVKHYALSSRAAPKEALRLFKALRKEGAIKAR